MAADGLAVTRCPMRGQRRPHQFSNMSLLGGVRFALVSLPLFYLHARKLGLPSESILLWFVLNTVAYPKDSPISEYRPVVFYGYYSRPVSLESLRNMGTRLYSIAGGAD